jgi:hypothetical protein
LLFIFLVWKMDFGFILNQILADVWGPPVIGSIATCPVLTGCCGLTCGAHLSSSAQRRPNRCSRRPCPHGRCLASHQAAVITPSCRLPAGVWHEPPSRVLPPDLYTSIVSKPTRAIPGLPLRPCPSASTRALLHLCHQSPHSPLLLQVPKLAAADPRRLCRR